jgi:hypothetical protein
MAQLINEIERFQKLAGLALNESQLNEIEVPSFLIQQVLKNQTDKSDRGNVELKVGTKNVLPKKVYRSMQEISIENLKGEENQYSVDDLIIVSGLNELTNKNLEEVIDEVLAKLREVEEKPTTSAPKMSSDVAGLAKLIQANSSLINRMKTVTNGQEVNELIEFILNTIPEKVTGVNKTKLKSIIDQRF